ncbi:hypothetical protein [Clostridium saccharoperbutylacetonicum]|uniref:hypothetical protein n=1 Tax=Clostridium saccharoperbutylacetonicum TaxID=36745 RepID=UPI000983DCBD|nr:hypothetical protein [Clostridium saccharoperbutylacetonicum]AQR98207.1 hypothetical protein CLSAP_55620 [Clostridium saccharoperbutylacetonicum]NSB34102.1 hypothetical protein [Clostridium saccharoperbutylacetonicum]
MHKGQSTLAKLKVKAKNVKIINSLINFNSRKVSKLSINSFNNSGKAIEVIVILTVNGGNEKCLRSIRELNKFLTKENIIYKFGYSEITTIPSTYEVIVNG